MRAFLSVKCIEFDYAATLFFSTLVLRLVSAKVGVWNDFDMFISEQEGKMCFLLITRLLRLLERLSAREPV